MKKLLFACSLFLFAAGTQAQDKETAKAELSKEKKAELKKMKEEHLDASFTEIGLKEDLVAQAKAVIEEAGKKSKELKEDKALTDEEKKAKKDAINDDKNAKLKEILGDKYKQWQEIRKKQKATEEQFVTDNSKA